jgi:hydroxyethylthiazole kinase-like uncharacterized protein yjeF
LDTRRLMEEARLRQVTGGAREAMYGSAATRQIEQLTASALPAHALMSRAGMSVARLARALQPHARRIWVACGPGNNGGDGLVAATHLHQWAQSQGGKPRVVVTHAAQNENTLPPDARNALQTARAAGVVFSEAPPADFDFAIDALLGIGHQRALEGRLAHWLSVLRTSDAAVLCVDLPSGLNADTGVLAALEGPCATSPGPRHTLSLLTLKPGLFTGAGRDATGRVWLDDLGALPPSDLPVTAWLSGPATTQATRPHASHKGSFGDVIVLGGQSIERNGAGMTGAAILAARAALHGGAGRVFVGLLEDDTQGPTQWDPVCPELMFRRWPRLLEPGALQSASVVCGCGGGEAVTALLPRLLSTAPRLVLDADALNAIAKDEALQEQLGHRKGRGWSTVLTPHPLEAARLLQSSTDEVMSHRLVAAQTLADRFGACCVLKGSGSIVAAPGEVPRINPSGNALLATAGTGDVLAGMVGSAIAAQGPSRLPLIEQVAAAVFQHGWLADHWADGANQALTASQLASRAGPQA